MTNEQRCIIEAAMHRIMPSDDGPGAAEANVIAYVDWITRQSRFEPVSHRFCVGIALLESLAIALWGMSFPACSADQQTAVLEQLQRIPHPTAKRFFVMLVNLALAGFLCAPKYGGNRNRVGWDFIDFRPHPLTIGAPTGEIE